jgi:hypothetical membrane protein
MKSKLAYAGIVGSVVFVVSLFLAVISYPSYNPLTNFLSDLGIGANSAIFFNLGLILTGICFIIFGYGLGIIFRKRAGFAGSVIFIIASFALIGVGLFTEHSVLHYPFAAAFFLLSIIALILIGIELQMKSRPYSYLSIICGIVVLACALAGMSPILEHVAVFAIGVAVISNAYHIIKN